MTFDKEQRRMEERSEKVRGVRIDVTQRRWRESKVKIKCFYF